MYKKNSILFIGRFYQHEKVLYNINSSMFCTNVYSPHTSKVEAKRYELDGLNKQQSVLRDDVVDEKNDKQAKSLLRATNHSRETATEITSNMIGSVQHEIATSNDDWYYFDVTTGGKITALLEMPSDSDYDLRLYSYEPSTETLTEIAYSMYGGNDMEQLSAVCTTAGRYYLKVEPYQATKMENALYYYLVRLDSMYDSNEPNDNPYQAKSLGNITSMKSAQGTIDSYFDTDWYAISLPSQMDIKYILNNVPTGAEYAIDLFDTSFNHIDGFSTAQSNSSRLTLDAGNYLIRIITNNGKYNASQNYKMDIVIMHSPSSSVYITNGGNHVEITNTDVYVNGAAVNLEWEFVYNLNYYRHQWITKRSGGTNNTAVNPSSYKNGTFLDGQHINSSSDCIAVTIKNFDLHHYCSSPYTNETRPFETWEYIYIDANSGQTIGSEANIYVIDYNINNTFTPFN